MKTPNPTPNCPTHVFNDSDYEVMTNYLRGHYWPSAEEIIVRHKKSNTYWKAIYAVREDDSDADFPATWKQVIPNKIEMIEYKEVK